MSAASGNLFFGSTLSFYVASGTTGSYTAISQVESVTGNELTVNAVECKDLANQVIGKLAGYKDAGEVAFVVKYNATQSASLEAFTGGVAKDWKLTLPTGSAEYFTGWVSKFGREWGDGEGELKNNIAITLTDVLTTTDPNA